MAYSKKTYKVYTALLTQTSTNAPVATVLENTLGGTLVWGYTSSGVYTATLAGVFIVNKTYPVIVVTNNADDGTAAIKSFVRTSDNVLTLSTTASTNNVITSSPIEIRVYP